MKKLHVNKEAKVTFEQFKDITKDYFKTVPPEKRDDEVKKEYEKNFKNEPKELSKGDTGDKRSKNN